MMMLGILRHSKSSWGDAGAADFDRPLNDRGRAAAERVGRELAQRALRFDHVLASPAARVRETLDRLERGYGALPGVEFDESLYAASVTTLLDRIKALGDDVRAPLLVGHNPGVHALLRALTRDDDDGLRRRVADKYPTGAFAMIELPALRWDEVTPGSGRVRTLILPRELD